MTNDERKEVAMQAFLRDLPDLMRERSGEFVAYRGEEVLGFGKQKHLLYQECMGRGLGIDEFIVFCVEPWETEMFIGPLWDL